MDPFRTITTEDWREFFQRHRAHPPVNEVSAQIHTAMSQLDLAPTVFPTPEELDAAFARWEFLFPAGQQRPRYRLHGPDMLELQWSVFDTVAKVTIARGATPVLAVDAAFERVRVAQSETPSA